MKVLLDPAEFRPVFDLAIEEALQRIQAMQPKDKAGSILLDKAQAAKAMGVSETTIDRWRGSHGLPFLKLDNGKPMFRPESLREWAKSREEGSR
jgi:helix-turn-helix protein